MKSRMDDRAIAVAALALSTLAGPAAEPDSRSSQTNLLLFDRLGRPMTVATNELNLLYQPSGPSGLLHQIPKLHKGAVVSEAVLERTHEARAGSDHREFFPPAPPKLATYLMGLDEFGNTASQTGALIPTGALAAAVQQPKFWLSEIGLRYSLEQSFSYVNMTDVMQGENALAFYSFDFLGKWTVFNAREAGTAGWLSVEVLAKTGLGTEGKNQSAQSNLGTVTSPTGIWPLLDGVRVPEVAWQESLRDGELVVVAGMVNQGNYFDLNSYANNGRGQFINSALINSMVLPLPSYNLGLNLQWQPASEWYVLLGASAGNRTIQNAPWSDFTWNQWTVLSEFGYAPGNFLGLGPGDYRVQPFLAEAGGPSQAGLCFNLQQQLGPRSPFAWFGRFGFGGAEVAAGAAAEIGTGFLFQAPLKAAGLVPKLNIAQCRSSRTLW
jgi:porin